MSYPLLVGITGPARAGKDTLGSGLALIAGFTPLSFAEPIRTFVASLIGLSVAEMGPVKEIPHPALGGKTPRFAMQTLGTEWGRDMIDPDLWIKATMAQVDCLRKSYNPVVITDVRFDSEARAIVDAGGRNIRLSRPKAGLSRQAAAHASEAGVTDALVSAQLCNDATPADLIDKAMAELGYRTELAGHD